MLVQQFLHLRCIERLSELGRMNLNQSYAAVRSDYLKSLRRTQLAAKPEFPIDQIGNHYWPK